MKSLISTFCVLVGALVMSTQALGQNEFITRWETTSNNESITIPTTGSGYNYIVEWGDGTIETAQTGNATHTYAVSGLYDVKISGDFPRIFFNDDNFNLDLDQLVAVTQWGDIAWTSMEWAFAGCRKAEFLATDTPDLSGVTSLKGMFAGTRGNNFESYSLQGWDVSTITDISYLFYQPDVTISFTSDMSGWDVSNVTNMSHAFYEMRVLNSAGLANWNVSAVTDMSYTFARGEVSSSLSGWNVGNVTNMEGMFFQYEGATIPVSGGWNVSNVTNMKDMFGYQFIDFSFPDITAWNVGNVTNMSGMFSGGFLLPFNQDISGWDVSKVTDMSAMFQYNPAFDQDISGWDVSQVTDMSNMFQYSPAFDQDLGAWDIGQVTNMSGMFDDQYEPAGLSNANYDSALLGWFTDSSGVPGDGVDDVPSNITFDAGTSRYCEIGARDALINDLNWNILDAGIAADCAGSFRLVFETTSANESVTLPTTGTGYDYDIYWGDGTRELGTTANPSHTYASAGNHIVQIYGSFPRIFFNDDNFNLDLDQLVAVTQWGDIAWTSMEWAFAGCRKAEFLATDTPDLSGVTSLKGMFAGTRGNNFESYSLQGWDVSTITDISYLFYQPDVTISFTSDMSGWDVSNVTNMSHAFYEMRVLNSAGLANWNVSAVTDMSYTFARGEVNSSLASWNVGNVTNMEGMFFQYEGATIPVSGGWNVSNVTNMKDMFGYQFIDFSFPDITAWNVGNVTNMSGMFSGGFLLPFNQDISGWDVSKVTDMSAMFQYNPAFDQDISGWDVSQVTDMSNMFQYSPAFDQNLAAWDIGQVTNMSGMFDDEYEPAGLSNSNYDHTLLGWSMDSSGVPGDGVDDVPSNVTFDAGVSQFCQGIAGRNDLFRVHNWNITDSGNACPEIFITSWQSNNPGSSTDTQITIPTDGTGYNYTVQWTEFGNASNTGMQGPFTGNATIDLPNTGKYVISITGDFPRIYSLSGIDPQKLLTVDQWGNNSWTSMYGAFAGCKHMRIWASDNPDLSQVTDMGIMFSGADAMNADLSQWDVSNVTSLFATFESTNVFNQDLSSWDVSNVTNMQATFANASRFDGDITSWDVGMVTDFSRMFVFADDFNQDLSSWDVSNAEVMNRMFSRAEEFNQDLSAWDVSGVTGMSKMFSSAFAFDQNLGAWDISAATSMADMFLNAPLSTENYDNTLIGWAALSEGETQIPSNLILDANLAIYCNSEDARTELIETYGWTINDAGPGLGCGSTSCIDPPANDICSGALPYAVGSGTVSGNLYVDCTVENSGCVGTDGLRDVWYSFEGSSAFLLLTMGTSQTDGNFNITVYEQCGSNDFIACTQAAAVSNSSTSIEFSCETLTPGNTYYVQLTSTGTTDLNYTFQIEDVTVSGCVSDDACNYDPAVNCPDASCIFPGCTDDTACNYDPTAGCEDGSCEFISCVSACPTDLNSDGQTGTGDLLVVLAVFGSDCEIPEGCPEDLNDDQQIGTGDLLVILADFGADCP